MKKLGKKISYFTKVFLVFGLLFSNLSSLKVVFAYEGEEETVISENKENEEIVDETTENTDEVLEEITDETVVDEENKSDEVENLVEDNNELENTEENKENEEVVENETNEETSSDETTNEEKDDSELVNDDSTTDEENNNEETTDTEVEPEVVSEEHNYTKELNDSATSLGLNKTYLFTEGKVKVVVGVNDSEIEQIVVNAFDSIAYEVVEDELILTDGDNTVTYKVVIYNEELLNKLMKVAVGNGEATEEEDVNEDGKVDAYDVVTLKQVLKNGFGSEVVNQKVTIESKFDGDTTDLSVGDSFTVQYLLTLSEYSVDGITGTIKYNKDMLSLDKVEVRNFNKGENYDGKFLYFGDYLRGTEKVVTDNDGNELTTYEPKDYVVVVMTFTVTSAGSDTISIDEVGYFYENLYYEGNTSGSLDVNVMSSNNRLSSVTVAGQEITIDELTDVYSITVGNDVTSVDLEYLLSDTSASVSSIVAPEELAVGENTITITVVAEDGEERTYTITVTREEEQKEEETTEEVAAPVNYQNTYNDNNYDDNEDDNKIEEKEQDDKKDKKDEDKKTEKEESKLSRVIIIILILLAIAGLIYLIFKDEDDEETKKANKEVDKLKKEELEETNSKKTNYNKKTNKKGR